MLSSMWVNSLAHLVYAVAIFLPQWTWLGIAMMLFNLMQLVGHG
ncbi:hypothetical protein [Actinobacillus succinogenes]